MNQKSKAKKNKLDERELCSSVNVACPFCGHVEPMSFDEGGGERQTLVDDCPVCCRPRVVHLDASAGLRRGPQIRVEREDGQ